MTEPMPSDSNEPTVQLRTLCKHTGLPFKQVRSILAKAGLDVRTARMFSRVNVAAAHAALGINANADPTSIPDQSTQSSIGAPSLEALAADAAAAAAKVPAPAPASTGTGNEDDPIPPAILLGEFERVSGAFPMPSPSNRRSDLYYWPINTNAGRQDYMIRKGWRFVTDEGHLTQLYPDGSWKRMRAATGRIRHMDLELACIPRVVWERRKAARAAANSDRRTSVEEAHQANIEQAKRELRDRLGSGGDRHIDYVEYNEQEATERAAMSADSRQARVFVNRPTSRVTR